MTEPKLNHTEYDDLEPQEYPEDTLDFEKIYLSEHARCLELEKQLNILRDKARKAMKHISDPDAYERLLDELNKE